MCPLLLSNYVYFLQNEVLVFVESESFITLAVNFKYKTEALTAVRFQVGKLHFLFLGVKQFHTTCMTTTRVSRFIMLHHVHETTIVHTEPPLLGSWALFGADNSTMY